MVKHFIGILEDDRDGRIPRFEATATALAAHGFQLVVRENVPDFVKWIDSSWSGIALLSLDHDLGLPVDRDGGRFDPGEGTDAVRFLASRDPSFPVIVHSSNPVGAERMMLGLADGGWTAYRLPPFGEDWIGTAWVRRVLALTGILQV